MVFEIRVEKITDLKNYSKKNDITFGNINYRKSTFYVYEIKPFEEDVSKVFIYLLN